MTEVPAPTIIDLYQRHGEAWARLRTRRLVERGWLDRFCAMVTAKGSVLDIGCGSGVPIGLELVERGFDLTGVDGAATMLSLFQRNLPGTPAYLMDMRALSLGRTFSGLLAWDSLFHLSPADQRGMFGLFKAHAAPGAALMFTSGDEEGHAMGVLQGDPLYHGSLNPGEYRALLDTSGFDVVSHVSADPSCGHRTVWLARQRT